MIKKSSYEFNNEYLRFDTEWQFEWDFTVEADGTIRFYPFSKIGDSRTWFFQGEGDPDTGETVIEHSEYEWQAENPIFEYHVSAAEDDDNYSPANDGDGTGPNQYTNEWDSNHPNNLTRYLRPESGIVKLINTVEFVHIDTVPPQFVSDANTDYIIFKKEKETDVVRRCSFVFTDSVGLDYHQIVIRLGNEKLFEYNRKEGPFIDTEKIKNVKIFSSGQGKYKVEFELAYGLTQEEVDELNQKKLILDVFDLSANHTEYAFGNNGTEEDKGKKEWQIVITDIDFSKLDRLIITYYDINPENMIVDVNTVGSTWVSIYNPNKDYWTIPIAFQLSDDSVGHIDESTIDTTLYSSTGTIKFKVVGIDECGFVTTQAWLETGLSADIDRALFSATYAEESLGFWRVLDPNGRLYNLKIYVPTFLKHTEWFDYVKFFELYLNSCYTDMKKKTCISALEKIARILDFNEVDRMEDELLPYYAKQYGCEFDIDLESISKLFEGKVDE